MSNETLTVRYDDITSAAIALDGEKEVINTKLAAYKHLIQDLVDTALVAEQTSVALESDSSNFVREVGKATTALSDYADFLRDQADTYESLDTDIAAQLGGGGGSLGELRLNLSEAEMLNEELRFALEVLRAKKSPSDRIGEIVFGTTDISDTLRDFHKGWKLRRGDLIEDIDNLHGAFEEIFRSLREVDSKTTASFCNDGSN